MNETETKNMKEGQQNYKNERANKNSSDDCSNQNSTEAENPIKKQMTEQQWAKKQYDCISIEDRQKFIKIVLSEKLTIKQASKQCKIKFSTAKAILKTFKKEGRIGKKKTRSRPFKQYTIVSEQNQSDQQDHLQYQITSQQNQILEMVTKFHEDNQQLFQTFMLKLQHQLKKSLLSKFEQKCIIDELITIQQDNNSQKIYKLLTQKNLIQQQQQYQQNFQPQEHQNLMNMILNYQNQNICNNQINQMNNSIIEQKFYQPNLQEQITNTYQHISQSKQIHKQNKQTYNNYPSQINDQNQQITIMNGVNNDIKQLQNVKNIKFSTIICTQ